VGVLKLRNRSVEDVAQATESIELTKKPFLKKLPMCGASSSLSVARRAIPDSFAVAAL
jgi:hypothetical protein